MFYGDYPFSFWGSSRQRAGAWSVIGKSIDDESVCAFPVDISQVSSSLSAQGIVNCMSSETPPRGDSWKTGKLYLLSFGLCSMHVFPLLLLPCILFAVRNYSREYNYTPISVNSPNKSLNLRVSLGTPHMTQLSRKGSY